MSIKRTPVGWEMKRLSAFDPDLGLMILSEDTLYMSGSRYVFTCNLLCSSYMIPCCPRSWKCITFWKSQGSKFREWQPSGNKWIISGKLLTPAPCWSNVHNGIFLPWLWWGLNERRYVKRPGELGRDYLRLILRFIPLKTNHVIQSHIKHIH